MSAYQGYAGFRRPADIVSDNVLSDSQKTETLLHWKRAVARLLPLASVDEREAYTNLTIELAAALTHIDIVPAKPHIFEKMSLKTSKP